MFSILDFSFKCYVKLKQFHVNRIFLQISPLFNGTNSLFRSIIMQWKCNFLALSYNTQFNRLYLVRFYYSFSFYFCVTIFTRDAMSSWILVIPVRLVHIWSLYNMITILKCQWTVFFYHALLCGVTNIWILEYMVFYLYCTTTRYIWTANFFIILKSRFLLVIFQFLTLYVFFTIKQLLFKLY